MNATLAHIYIPGGQSVARRTFPGHVLKFVGGHAEVKHEYDMPHVLAMPDAKVQIDPGWAEWLPKWESQIPGYENKVKATVEVIGSPVAVVESPDAPESDGLWTTMPEVVFGKHKIGCHCGFCEKKRHRVLESRSA